MAELLVWSFVAVNFFAFCWLLREIRRYRQKAEECDGLRIALQSCIREVSLNALELQLAQQSFRQVCGRSVAKEIRH